MIDRVLLRLRLRIVLPGAVVAALAVVTGDGRIAAAPADAKAVAATLASPSSAQIPVAALEPAVRQAVATGAASIVARVLADPSGSGLAYPPSTSLAVVGTEEVPATRVTYEEAVYDHEYKDVEQLVPEVSAGQPTGRFVPGRVRVLVKSTKVGTRMVERLVPDPKGSETMKRPKYERSGPDIYPVNTLGFNGMALYVLARAGLGEHPATTRLARAIAEKLGEFGVSDLTFDVAWIAAGFAALGRDSPHAELARELAGKLIDGQIREKGEPQGLWGPVCINYPYAAKIVEYEQGLKYQLEEVVPKRIEAAPPQEKEAVIKHAQEMRKVSNELVRALRTVSPYATRMTEVTKPFPVTERVILPGMPHYVYNRVVSDVESTAAAAMALAEAARHGLMPKETARVAIRGKKVQYPEKADVTIRLAAEKLAAEVGGDGGVSGLVRQAVNTGFDKSKFPYHDVPFKGEHPPLIDVQTACSCAYGLAALESLAGLDPQAAKTSAAARERVRGRVAAIAERWYRETAPDFRKPWADVYASFTVSREELTKSAELPLPHPSSPPVAELPWGGVGARYAIVPALVAACGGATGAKPLDDPLCRQIAYRLVTLQDGNGQWQGVSYDLLSSARDAVGIAWSAVYWNLNLNHVPARAPSVVPTPFNWLLHHARPYQGGYRAGIGGHAWHLDNAAQPTLASLVFLVAAADAPVGLAGVPILPEPDVERAAPTDGKPAPLQLPPTVRAATGVERPNTARPALAEGVLAAAGLDSAPPPPATVNPVAIVDAAGAAPAGKKPPTPEPVDKNLGTIDDLLDPNPIDRKKP